MAKVWRDVPTSHMLQCCWRRRLKDGREWRLFLRRKLLPKAAFAKLISNLVETRNEQFDIVAHPSHDCSCHKQGIFVDILSKYTLMHGQQFIVDFLMVAFLVPVIQFSHFDSSTSSSRTLLSSPL